MSETIIVTGGAGFIGSNFILQWLGTEGSPMVNFDKLTYAGNLRNLESVSSDKRYCFVQGDIAERREVRQILQAHLPPARRSACLLERVAADREGPFSICAHFDGRSFRLVGPRGSGLL